MERKEDFRRADEGRLRRRRLVTMLLLVMLALASATAATAAWLTIADRTRVETLGVEVTSGVSLRFDLDAHESFDDYVTTLGFDEISARIRDELGFSPKDTPLTPVTSRDARSFALKDGTEVAAEDGAYLTFTLHFTAQTDTWVHLTSADGSGGGTRITSSEPGLAESLRLSFETPDGKVWIYDPGMGDAASEEAGVVSFGLPPADRMVLSDGNRLFFLSEGEDVPVKVRLWLEGTDPSCDNSLKGADYSVALRFEGTDENNRPLSVDRNTVGR